MIASKITKTWDSADSRWTYSRNVAYLDGDGRIQTVWLCGQSKEHVEQKTKLLTDALIE